MKQKMTQELHAYWDETRGPRLAPERADIDPAGIRSLLGHTFVLEVDCASRFPFRLSGSRINALFLRELRGTSFIDLWDNNERARIANLLFSVLDDTIPAVVGAQAAPPGRLPIDLELLVLPLRHHGKTHARLLGSLAPATQAPWFGLITAEPLELRSIRFLHAAKSTGKTTTAAAQVAKPPTEMSPAPGVSITRHDHLTVYSNRR